MNDLPNIDVGSPPDSDDMSVVYDWWADAQSALRDHFDDGADVWVGEDAHMAPRWEWKDVEKSESREVPDGNGGVRLETKRWTEKEKHVVDEKKVTTGFHLDVAVASETEKSAVIALAHSAGLTVRERGGTTRFTHRLAA